MNILKNLALSAISAAALMAGSSTANADESFILAHAMNTDHVFHSISESFMEKLGEDSGFKVDYHPAGDLGDWTSLFEQSMQGVVPMSLTWGASDFDQRLDLCWVQLGRRKDSLWSRL